MQDPQGTRRFHGDSTFTKVQRCTPELRAALHGTRCRCRVQDQVALGALWSLFPGRRAVALSVQCVLTSCCVCRLVSTLGPGSSGVVILACTGAVGLTLFCMAAEPWAAGKLANPFNGPKRTGGTYLYMSEIHGLRGNAGVRTWILVDARYFHRGVPCAEPPPRSATGWNGPFFSKKMCGGGNGNGELFRHFEFGDRVAGGTSLLCSERHGFPV